jgi:MerR family transcriptional regulator, light-induced transcriptional regulator
MDSLPQEQSACDESPIGSGVSVRAGGSQGRPDAHAANDSRMSQLVRTIEHEIIPRLLVAHRASAAYPAQPPVPGQAITVAEVHHFTKLVLAENDTWALAQIAMFRSNGISIEMIYLDLLAPTAHYLGELWTEDLCSFADVTLGLCRLQRVLRQLSPDFDREAAGQCLDRRVLLLPSPGEQHTFGLLMVAEFFRRAGWDVSGGSWAQGADASSLVAADWFDVLGFSLGSEVHLQALTEGIRAARRAAANRAMVVIVGGPIFALHPEYADQAGADGVTIDGREAPSLAERLVMRTATQ